MKKPVQQLQSDDIAEQPYKGPSVASAMAGEGFIAHFQWAAIALGVVGGAAALFHKPTAGMLNRIRDHARSVRVQNPTSAIEHIKTGWGNFWLDIFGHGRNADVKHAFEELGKHGVRGTEHLNQQREVGLGLWIANHTVGLITPIRTLIHKGVEKFEWLRTALSAAGPFAFVGYFIVPIFLSGDGAKKGREGRRQFERARDEIIDLRARNDALRDSTQEPKARRPEQPEPEERLRISPDGPPVYRGEGDGAPAPREPKEKEPKAEWADRMQAQKDSAQQETALA